MYRPTHEAHSPPTLMLPNNPVQLASGRNSEKDFSAQTSEKTNSYMVMLG